MNRATIAAAALLLATASPAQAELTGNLLYSWCTSPKDTNRAICDGFVMGTSMAWDTASGLLAMEGENPARFLGLTNCPPAGHTIRQAIDIVVKHLEDHPELRDRPGQFNVLLALNEAWPCEGEQEP